MYRIVGLLVFVVSYTTFAKTRQVISVPKPYCEISDQAARFNFTPLSETAEDRVIFNEKSGESIRLSLCSTLRKRCNDLSHYSICLKKDNVEIGIGKAPPDSAVADSGRLTFQFTGDTCEGDKNYAVHITMKCDNEDGYNSQPELFPQDSDKCTFHMVWKTKAACSPEYTTNCTAVDKNHQHYDLSSLTLRSENYVVPVYRNNSNSAMILNVCHSIIYDYNATCTPKSGACLRNLTETSNKTTINVYNNLGRVANPPYFENDVLTLKYELGGVCTVDPGPGHVETVILFECDRQATNTLPEYEGGAEKCVHRFRWKTAAACSIESLKSPSTISVETCKVTDPLTNTEYNFRELMSKDFRSKSPNGTIYTFQICGSISDSSCPAGACNVEKKISMGSGNSNMLWGQGGPYLNYTDGAECGNGQRRYTLIAFFCGAEESAGAPVVMEDKDCALIIHWNTPIVCDKRIKCETKNGEVSLMPLVRRNDTYVVKAKDTEFHINVCRPLVPKPYLTCLHGSAACQVVPQANGQFVNETSLGYPNESPFIDDEKHVILRYRGGSACPEDKQNTLSSNLTFLCNYSIPIGAPRYKYYRSCTHVFEWATSVVCEKVKGQWKAGCVIENPLISRIINLTSLRETPVHNVKSQSGDRYNVSLCGEGKYCGGSAVCKDEKGYGSPSGVIFDYAQNAIILKFANVSRCGTGFHSSEVRLTCDESAEIGEPTLIETQSSESSCSLAFEWKTKVVCINERVVEKPMSGESNAKETTKNLEDSTSGHVGQYVGIGIFISCCIALIVCLWSSERRARFRSCCYSLTSRRERCRAQYTKVNATEEARLLLDIEDTTQCQTESDSDDELLDA